MLSRRLVVRKRHMEYTGMGLFILPTVVGTEYSEGRRLTNDLTAKIKFCTVTVSGMDTMKGEGVIPKILEVCN